MNVLLLEISHWHFPLYVKALRAANIRIAGISDRDVHQRARYSALFDCPAYSDWRQLLAERGKSDRIDAAFAFGRHAEMPQIGHALIDARIPFAIEKPAGLTAKDIFTLRRTAEVARVPVAVPLVQRVGPLQTLFDRLGSESAAFTTQSWRFNAGPPQRYVECGNAWMLDPAISGGGCLINLAIHFIDLALRLMPSTPVRVDAHVASSLHGTRVEDSALITLATEDGHRASIETGYNFPKAPAKRDFGFSLAGPDHYLKSTSIGAELHRPGQLVETVNIDLDSDPLYGTFVDRFLADIAAGRMDLPGLDDLEAAMRIVDQAYSVAAHAAE